MVTPVCVRPPPKKPMVLESKRALDETGGDEGQSDGDVVCICRNQALRDGLVDERLVCIDEIVRLGGYVVDADLLGKLDANVASDGFGRRSRD